MLSKLLNFLYSIYFNYRFLPLKTAVYLPIEISTNLKYIRLKRGQLEVLSKQRGSIKLGIGGSPGMGSFYSSIIVMGGAKLIFHGSAMLSEGTCIRCDKDSMIEFGDKFYCNCNCYIRSTSKITIGKMCTLGWYVTINTSDGHQIWYNDIKNQIAGDIVIEDNVWLTPNVVVNKDAYIPARCIVMQKSVVSKKFIQEGCLIGGIPAKVVRQGVYWER